MRTPFSVRLANMLPVFLIKEPERVLVAVFAFLMGLGTLAGARPSGTNTIPRWVVLEWALTLLVGGIVKFVGIFISTRHTLPSTIRSSPIKRERGRSLEILGAALIAMGSATYAWVLQMRFGLDAVFFILIFLAIALANLVRLIVSRASTNIREQIVDSLGE